MSRQLQHGAYAPQLRRLVNRGNASYQCYNRAGKHFVCEMQNAHERKLQINQSKAQTLAAIAADPDFAAACKNMIDQAQRTNDTRLRLKSPRKP